MSHLGTFKTNDHLKNIRALFVLSRGAHAVVLVYDVTKETSLTALEVSLAKLSATVFLMFV
jgi:hypothetical protein